VCVVVQGAWTAHWTGDNGATWRDLKGSVVTMLTMALLGVPMVGADICGFLGQTNDEVQRGRSRTER
jgi:alpha-glucosidase (family GH31 glycosyl hydrolase)